MRTALGALLASLGWIVLIGSGLTLNLSPSAPIGLWRHSHRSLEIGTYVLLYEPLKLIVAKAGDRIHVTSQGTSVEPLKAPIPESAPRPALPHFAYGEYTVPPHFLWLINPMEKSWDSRYIGFVPESMVIGTANPLWTKTSR